MVCAVLLSTLQQEEVPWSLPYCFSDVQTIRKEDFPLATLGPYLEEIRDEVVKGRGFALIRGVPVDR